VYYPVRNIITMPAPVRVESVTTFYASFFHELTHRTGAAHRLDREGITGAVHFGSERYSCEELTDEMGVAYIDGGLRRHIVEGTASSLWTPALCSFVTSLHKTAGTLHLLMFSVLCRTPSHRTHCLPRGEEERPIGSGGEGCSEERGIDREHHAPCHSCIVARWGSCPTPDLRRFPQGDKQI
jgi:hypothetical protein